MNSHLLVFGACTSRRWLMVPWLFSQGLLAAALAALALIYVAAFPGSQCAESRPEDEPFSARSAANFCFPHINEKRKKNF